MTSFRSFWGSESKSPDEFRDTRSLASLAENQRMRVGIGFRRASSWRDCSRMIRNTFPRCAACILTMHVGWKSLRADARARLLALSPCTLTLVHFHVGIVHLSSTEPSCSGEIPIFYPRSGLRCQLEIRTSQGLVRIQTSNYFHTHCCTRETPSCHDATARGLHAQQHLTLCLADYSI